MKWPRLKRDYVGLKAQTLRDLRNGFLTIPKGKVVTITYWHGGGSIASAPCPCCGVKAHMTKVQQRDLLLLPKGKP